MLTPGEWKRINDIALIIHSEKDIDDMRTHFFEAVEVLIPFEKAMFYFIEETIDGMHLKNPIFVNVDSSFATLYKKVFEEFKYGRVAISARRTMAFHDTDLMTSDSKMKNDMFMSFMKPYEIPYGAGIEITKNKKATAEVSFFRREEQGDFAEKELQILDILKDHLEIRINGIEDREGDRKNKEAHLIDFGLTQRELEIAMMVADGLWMDDISERLEISKSTGKRHLHNIYAKMNVGGRTELIGTVNKL